MKRSFLAHLALAGFVFLSGLASAALKVGDPAPKIAPGKWAQGEPIKELEGDKVYIVEFWATWCGPCIQAIPHVDAFSKKYAKDGLVVVGQNLGEDAQKVNAFVQKMGAKMSYRVAVDDASATMANTWLKAAGQSGIPCAFVVNKKGKVAYIGHPMQLTEAMLKKWLDQPGTKPTPEPEPEVTVLDEETKQAVVQAAILLSQEKSDEAAVAIAELHDKLPRSFRHLGGLLELDLMVQRKQYAEAVDLAKFLSEDFKQQPTVVADIAHGLVQPDAATPEMLSTARKLAEPLAGSQGAARFRALSVMARASFLDENLAEAIRSQKAAVEAAPADQREAAKTVLSSYETQNTQ